MRSLSFLLLSFILLALPFVGLEIAVETIEYVNIIDLVDEPVEVFADLGNVH